VTSVVSTEAERSEAKRRDLFSASTELIVETRSLDYAALRAAPLGTTGKQREMA
jgi:hypothetical protein